MKTYLKDNQKIMNMVFKKLKKRGKLTLKKPASVMAANKC